MKIRPVGAELFHADGQMDRHGAANSRFSHFCERAQKFYDVPKLCIYVVCRDFRTNNDISVHSINRLVLYPELSL